MSNNNNSKISNLDTSAYITTNDLINNWVTTATAINTYYDTDSIVSSNIKYLVNFMTEKEIDGVLDAIFLRLKRAKDEDNSNFKNIISEIVRSRHFSEEFLMKYISYFSKNDALKCHSGDIQSGEYSKLGLYYDVSE